MMDLAILGEAFKGIGGPLTFAAFLALCVTGGFGALLHNDAVLKLFKNRFGLGKRDYFTMLSLSAIMIFMVVVLSLWAYVKPQTLAEQGLLGGGVLLMSLLAVGYAWLSTKNNQGRSFFKMSSDCDVLQEQYNNVQLRITGLELTKSRLGANFSSIDQAELLRARQEKQDLEKQLKKANCA